MPRAGITDLLSNHLFWAFDASQFGTAFPVFTPVFGFSGISAPELIVETEDFIDGTYIYPRSVVKNARVSSVTFQRGASMFDSDFYDWITHAIYGTREVGDQGGVFNTVLRSVQGVTFRRNLVVIQFTRISAFPDAGTELETTNGALTLLGPLANAFRVPGRAWLLHDCIPVRYKPASDFDASSAAISIAELEVKPEYIEEFNLGIKP